MRKGFLLKVILLVLMVLVLVAAVVVLQARSSVTTVNNAQTQTFFEQFIIAGGPIVWFVLLPISILTVFLAAEHSLTIRRSRLLPPQAPGEIIETIGRLGLRQSEEKIARRNDLVSTAISDAITKGRGDWFRMRSALTESLQDQASHFLRKIEWVNLIGNVAPMVGLFGTVYGMIKLFNTIVVAGGQPQPAQLADGISIALVTTFWGLFIAIPALAIYGVFRNRIETLISDAAAEADGVMRQIKENFKKQKLAEAPPVEKTKIPIKQISPKSAGKLEKFMPS
jgi:biopolymer transport protein ExbB